MDYTYKTSGVCSRSISFEIAEDGSLHNLSFEGGCNGNLKGIGLLCEGMDAREVAKKLGGNRCGMKSTSCPDQLSKAIRAALGE